MALRSKPAQAPGQKLDHIDYGFKGPDEKMKVLYGVDAIKFWGAL